MEEDFKEISSNLETTLSSELISLPSGQKVDNISTVTELSDSDLDAKKLSSDLETSVSQVASSILNKMSSHTATSLKAEIIPESLGYNLPLQVRNTLQANASMLIDKNILKDLLHPENANYANNLLNIQRKFSSVVSQQCTVDAQNGKELEKECFSLKNYNPSSKTTTRSEPEDVSSIPYLSISSTPKKSKPVVGVHSSRANQVIEPTYQEPKHVNFAQNIEKERISAMKRRENEVSGIVSVSDHIKSVYNMHSFTSYGPEIVFDKLGEIRSHLETVRGDEETNASDLPLSRLLVAKLNSQKQRTKDLEEELTLNEASLAKTTCELEVVQKRLMRREEQLKEAGDQIGKLQTEWQSIQQRLMISIDAYRNQNEQMRKAIESLKKEKENLDEEVNTLREESKELSSLKVKAEGMKSQVEICSKQSKDILEENQRLNRELKEKEDKVIYYEKDHLPRLAQEMEKLTEEKESLHVKLDTLTIAKNELEDEMKMLKERHSVLLQKAIEETELKEKAVQEKENTLDAVDRIKNERKSLLKDLHQHYQNQLESILVKKANELKTEFEAKQSLLQEKFCHQIQIMKQSFDSEREEIQRRNTAEVEYLKIEYEKEAVKRSHELREMTRENEFLRSQREAIVTAISSVLPHSSCGWKVQGKADHSPPDVEDRPNRNPTPTDGLNKYHLTHVGGLEAYRVDTNPPSKSTKGNTQTSQKSVPCSKGHQFPVPPLITSTSLSSLSDGSDTGSSEGKVTVRERKQSVKGRSKSSNPHSAKVKSVSTGRKLNGKTILTAAEIIGSIESLSSSKQSSNDVLREVDKEMADLVQELNSMSEIVASHCADETPKHDTSLEQDSAHLALRKIDRVSDMLASTWKGLSKPKEKP